MLDLGQSLEKLNIKCPARVIAEFRRVSSSSNQEIVQFRVGDLMDIGHRLGACRQERRLSLSALETGTGLSLPYISRIETGYVITGLETLEKLVKALDVPLYIFFSDGIKDPKPLIVKGRQSNASAEQPAQVAEFEKRLTEMNKRDRALFMMFATKMATRTGKPRCVYVFRNRSMLLGKSVLDGK
jgi:transcriptional regulator with XRE-family HTH domain